MWLRSYDGVGARGVIVPSHEIEIFLLNGWKLTDEPHCSCARMLPPPSVPTEGKK